MLSSISSALRRFQWACLRGALVGTLLGAGCATLGPNGVANTAEAAHVWPLENGPHPVLSHFGERRGGSRVHQGLDLATRKGTRVLSVADGRVSYSGRMKGYGRCVFIQHGDGLETRYAHLKRRSARVGSEVRAGEILGRSGASGNASTPHLHFEVRRNGESVDPRRFLQSLGK